MNDWPATVAGLRPGKNGGGMLSGSSENTPLPFGNQLKEAGPFIANKINVCYFDLIK
ncbi:hypothetical protein [Aeromonas sp. S41-2]|uniref:hypothetical protein n=1 Tax=Aeromonas sp. S41-2 TaxID=2990502 RepID=UPI0022E31A28|nr:hypothetical protein [Aeromonas sp. S41-2]